MYYEQNEIIDDLKCPRCKQTFIDPRNLPCWETICINCIEELKSNNDCIDCFFCNEKHKIPSETGFKSNKYLSMILSKKPRKIYQGKTIEEFKINLDRLTHAIGQLETNIKNSHLEVIEHCAQVRNQIDILAEEQINQINTIRQDFISEVKEYEKECLANIEKNDKIFEEDIKNSMEYIQRCKNYLKDEIIDDELVEQKNSEMQKLKDAIQRKQTYFKSIQFNGSLLSLKPNKPIRIFGELKHTPLISYERFYCELTQTLSGHSDGVYALELLDEHRIASGSNDKSIRIWNIQSGECIQLILDAHEERILCMRSLNNFTLVSGSQDNSIKIWNIESGKLIKTLNGHTDAIRCILKLKTNELISCSHDKTIKIWNFDNCEVIKTLTGHSNGVFCVVSLNNRTIASGSSDNTIIIWDIETAQILRQLEAHKDLVWSLIFLENGNLASSSQDNTIKLWHVETGTVLKTFIGHTQAVYCLAELKNGNIASASSDNTIRIWDSNSGELLKTIEAHSKYVFRLLILNNGYLISASEDSEIKIWK